MSQRGEQYGKYQLVRRIGTGGMAEVFLARTQVAQGLNKQLVIKKIHPAFARSRQFVSMFVDEAKIALGLNHPNIVQVFDFGQVGDTFFLAMEYLEGMDLLRLTQHAGQASQPLPFGLASYVVQQACKGLDYAHRKTDDFGEPLGIVHRDVSQQNVLVSWDGAVKIVDFGIARARDVHEETGVIKGKFAYMSPEQARGDPVDRRSDVFSLGVVLFELVCRQPLYKGKGRELLDKVRAGAIPRPRYIDSSIPRELEQVILQALAYHPGDRFQTARDLQNALGRFQFQLASDTDELVDSSTLAQFVASVTPDDVRRRAPMPPTAGTPASMPRVDGDSSLDDIGSQTTPPPRSADLRERKYVFVVEGHVCGGRELERRVGGDRAREMLRDFSKVAENIAYKHDAHIHRRENSEFTFVVGLPVAGEDDSARAIRLALALVDALDGIGVDVEPELRLAVGIQRGVAVFKRERGRKFSYELAQSTTTIARKLAREAQGAEILVGGRVYRVARADWKFEELSSIELPAEPDTHPGTDGGSQVSGSTAKVYRLRGPRDRAERLGDRSGREVSLLGRELELKALRDAYRHVLVNRDKRQLLIIGDAGVGKRSLVLSFLEGIPQGEAVIIRAAARVATSMTPFGIVADLARDLLGLADGASPSEVTRRVERAAALLYPAADQSREVRGLVQAINLLLGGVATEDGSDIDPAERRSRVLQALRRVESRLASDKPLIVIGEDVHWADDESSEVFRELLKIPSQRPILGIVTARPEPRVLDAVKETEANVIRLDELGDDERMRLIKREFVPGEQVDTLAQQIVSRAGGNPYFIREVLDSLVDRGIVVAEPADSEHPGLLRWVQRDAPIHVPTTVESLLATRVDRLPHAEKDTLLRAAVLGRRFPGSALEALLGRRAKAELDQLIVRGLLTKDGPLYAFRNDMAMSVAYGLLPAEERTRLHLAAAGQIVGSPTYRQGQDDAVIARHYELAGDAAAASDRYLRAAAHAVNVGGSADAFRQLTRALKLLPESDRERRFTARRQREEILGRLARRPEQLREIHNLRKEAEAIGTPDKLALAHCRLAQFYIDVGKAPAASRAVVPALEFAQKAGDPLLEAEALRLRSSIARLVGNNDEAIVLVDKALALCGESPEALAQRAMILNNRGTTLWNMGKLHEASESYAEALVIYRMLKLPRQEARALNNMGIVFAALGEFEEALAHYKSSLKIDQELGDRGSLALKLGNIGQTYSDLGDTARAERYLTKALKFADQTGDASSACDGAISLSQVYLQKGQARRALNLLDRGLELAIDQRERYQEIRALTYIAFAQLEAGDPPEGALELARSATELARKAPMLVGQIYGLCAQGMALAKLERPGDAMELAARAVELLANRDEETEGSEQIHYIYANLCEQAGNTDDARKAVAEGLREVEAKLSKLRDPELREIYSRSKTPAALAAAAERLGVS